jgi:hypothetical protein
MYNTLFETPYNDRIVERIRALQDIKEHYNPTEPYHIPRSTYPSVNGSGRVLMCGGARGADPRSLGLSHDPRYLRSGSTINYPVIHFNEMMANPVAGGSIRSNGFHYQDDFNPYYNSVVSANMGTNRPTFSRGGSKVGNFFKKVGNFLKPVGREVMPIIKDVGKDLLKDAIKGAIVGAGVKRRGRPRKVVGVGHFEGSGHPSGSPIPNDMYSGTGKFENKVIRVMERKMTGGVALYKPNGKIFRGMTHVMPDGVIHTGKNHTKSSVPLTEMTAGNARTFFRKVGNTFKTIGRAVAPVAVPVLKEVGKDLLKGAIMGAVVGAGKKRGRPKKMVGGMGASVDSAGILSVTPNPPPALQVVGGKSNIGRKIKNTFKKVGKFLEPAVPVLKQIGQEVYKEVKPILVEEGKKALKEGIKGAISGSGTKKGQVRKTARKAYEGVKKPNARAEIVKKIMKERGVKMIEASKIVKAEGLY